MLNIAGLKIPMIGDHLVTGNVYFVDSGATGASDSNDGLRPDRGHALATLDGAINKCTANNGDVIVLMPGHAETTTAIAWDTAGIKVIGIGHGADRPTITATTDASDLIDITAASCHLENVILAGAASGNTALVDISTAGNDCTFVKVVFKQAETPTAAITLNGDRCEWHDCTWMSTADGPDHAISVESTSNDCVVKGCMFNYGRYGLDDPAIIGEGDPIAVCEGWIIQDCTFVGLEGLVIDFNSSANANVASLLSNCSVGFGADTADIDGAFDAASTGLVNVLVTDNVAARGRHIPVTTPA